MKSKPLGRVIAILLIAIFMLGLMPVTAADVWNETMALADVATSTPNRTNFKWSENWRVYMPDQFPLTADSYECWIKNEYVEFSFTGTGVKVDVFKNVQDITDDGVDNPENLLADDASIFIDGTEYSLELGANAHTVGINEAFSITGLAEGTHTAKIVLNEDKNFYLHSVSVLNGNLAELTEDVWSEEYLVLSPETADLNQRYFTATGDGWRKGTGSPTCYESFLVGDVLEFTFTGTGFKINADCNHQPSNTMFTDGHFHNNNVTVSIDGGEPIALNLSSDTGESKIGIYEVLSVEGLENKEHTVELVTGKSASTGQSFYIYSVSILNGSIAAGDTWSILYPAISGEKDENNRNLPNIEYYEFSSNWRDIGTVPDTYETWLPGETVTFDFEGTGAQIFAYVNTQDRENNGFGVGVDTYVNNNVTVSIDGGEPQPLAMVADSYTVGVYDVITITGLSEGTHTAVITNNESASSDTSFYFYGVKVANGTLNRKIEIEINPVSLEKVSVISEENWMVSLKFSAPVNIPGHAYVYLCNNISPDASNNWASGDWQCNISDIEYVDAEIKNNREYSETVNITFAKPTMSGAPMVLPITSCIRICEYGIGTTGDSLIPKSVVVALDGSPLAANRTVTGSDVAYAEVDFTGVNTEILYVEGNNGNVVAVFEHPVKFNSLDTVKLVVNSNEYNCTGAEYASAENGFSNTVTFSFDYSEDMLNATLVISDTGEENGVMESAVAENIGGGLLIANTEGDKIVKTLDYSKDTAIEVGDANDTTIEDGKKYNFMNADTGRHFGTEDITYFTFNAEEGVNRYSIYSEDLEKYLQPDGTLTNDKYIYIIVKAEGGRYKIKSTNGAYSLFDNDEGESNVAVCEWGLADNYIENLWFATLLGEEEPLKIMPLGDSITYGVNPDQPSYDETGSTPFLSRKLIETEQTNGRIITVGSVKQKSSFESDSLLYRNEGHPGWLAHNEYQSAINLGVAGLDEYIDGWMAKYTPDIICMQIGTNDCGYLLSDNPEVKSFDETFEGWENLVDQILFNMEEDDILIAATPTHHGANTALDNAYKKWGNYEKAYVAELIEAGETRVSIADNYTYVLKKAGKTSGICSDSLHLSQLGYEKMGESYYKSIMKAYYGIDLFEEDDTAWSELYPAISGEKDENNYNLPNTDYFRYSSNWRDIGTVPDTYETWLPGETVSFSFSGTGLEVYAYVNSQDRDGDGFGVGVDTYVNNNVTISIDGGDPQAMKMTENEFTVGIKCVYSVVGLSEGTHIVTITCGQSASNDTGFYFNGVKVENGTLNAATEWGDEILAVDRNDVASTAFAYSGDAWSQFTDGAGVKFMRCGTAGGTMDFAFNGTGVRIIASVNVQNGESLNNDEVYVSIDGKEFTKANMWVNAIPGSAAVVYEISGLTEGDHTVALENRARTSSYGSQFFFHGVQLSAGGYLVDAPEWTELIRAVSDSHVVHPDFSYTGDWTEQSGYMRAVAEKQSVTFSFDGTGLKVYAMVNVQSNGSGGWIIYNNDVAYISIDGGEPQPLDLVMEGVVANSVVYSVQGLAEGEHTATITNGANVNGNNREFYFGGISVLDGDIVDSRGEINSLQVETMPKKLYFGDDTLIDLTGLTIRANNDPNYIITPNLKSVGITSVTPNASGEYHISKDNPNTVQEIVCTYKDMEFIVPVIYYSVESIEVIKHPKTEYKVTDTSFIASGGEIAITLGDETITEKPVATELLRMDMIKSEFPAQKNIGDTFTVECNYINTDFGYEIAFVGDPGDINCDGKVDEADVTLLVKGLVGDTSVVLEKHQLAMAELDGFEGITMNDATELMKAIADNKQPVAPQPNFKVVNAPAASELTGNAQGEIKITENNVRHIGRTYYNETIGGFNFNPGCSGFEFKFNGTGASIELIGDTIFSGNTYPIVQVFIDGEDTPSKYITTTGSKAWYTLCEGLTSGEHTVKILKQNQTAYSSAVATSIKVNGVLMAPPEAKDFGIQIIGDSISAGMYNETVGSYEGPYVLAEENSYNTAYAMVARMLDADFTVFANSGDACNESAGPVRRDIQVGRDVTERYKYTDLYWGYKGLQGKDNTRTDLIIINLGTNDNDYIGSNPVRKQEFVDSYVELLRHLRSRYPEAPIVCTYGVIITSPCQLIEQAVNTVRTEDGDMNVYYHLEQTLPETRHPRTSENVEYAKAFVNYLRTEGIID